MRLGIPKIAAFFALLAATPSLAETMGGSAAPQPFLRSPDAQEREDPNISKPVEPGVDCIAGDLSTEEQGNLREAHVNPNNKICLPQQDAFKRAAEAASYLAIYQQNFSDYGVQMRDPGRKKEIQDSVNLCVSNDPKCSEDSENGRRLRADLLKSLVQYNFGKELKSQIIENESRAERMKSMDSYIKADRSQGAAGMPSKVLNWNNSLHTSLGQVRKNTFRLNPNQLVPFDPAQVRDRAVLGQKFNREFNGFVDNYTSSTGQRGPKSRWHYVEAKTSALEAQGVTIAAYDNNNLDLREGKSAIDRPSLDHDVRTQESAEVKDIVASYREHYKDVLANPTGEQTVVAEKEAKKKTGVDSMQLAYQDAGFGLNHHELAKIGTPDGLKDPKEVAALVVVSINRAITDTEKMQVKQHEERFPSSLPNGAKPIIVPSVTVDMKAFDAFLNEIWPGGPKENPPAG